MVSGLPAGYRLIEVDEIDSTNEEALRRIDTGAQGGTVVLAQSQTRGRGRKGARWISPSGNLYMSVIVEPPDGVIVGQLAYVAAVAIGDAVRDMTPTIRALSYKWPNDLMLAGAKLGGILIEGGARGAYVMGLGLNLASAPTESEFEAIALAEAANVRISPRDMSEAVCRHFAGWFGTWTARGFRPVREEWLRHATGIGSPAEVRLRTETVSGVFADIDEAGALLLDLPDGTRREIVAGAIYFPPER